MAVIDESDNGLSEGTGHAYAVGMTEPSNADVLAAVQALAADVASLRADFSQHRAETQHSFDQVRADVAATRADISQVRADLAGVKADTAYTERYISDLQAAVRAHVTDPNAHRPAA